MRRVDPIERRNDKLGRRIAALIRADPKGIERAKEALDRYLARNDVEPPRALLSDWRDALDMLDPEPLATFLESTTPRARRMRVWTPFLALIPS